MILRREPFCRMCQRAPATIVDHITPKGAGGTDDPANLQGLCARCNAVKTAQDGVYARGLRPRQTEGS